MFRMILAGAVIYWFIQPANQIAAIQQFEGLGREVVAAAIAADAGIKVPALVPAVVAPVVPAQPAQVAAQPSVPVRVVVEAVRCDSVPDQFGNLKYCF